MKQQHTKYAVITKMYVVNIEIEDGTEEEDEDCSHEQNMATNAKLEELEQTLGDYLGNGQDIELFLSENAPTEIKSIEHCEGSDDWKIED